MISGTLVAARIASRQSFLSGKETLICTL